MNYLFYMKEGVPVYPTTFEGINISMYLFPPRDEHAMPSVPHGTMISGMRDKLPEVLEAAAPGSSIFFMDQQSLKKPNEEFENSLADQVKRLVIEKSLTLYLCVNVFSVFGKHAHVFYSELVGFDQIYFYSRVADHTVFETVFDASVSIAGMKGFLVHGDIDDVRFSREFVIGRKTTDFDVLVYSGYDLITKIMLEPATFTPVQNVNKAKTLAPLTVRQAPSLNAKAYTSAGEAVMIDGEFFFLEKLEVEKGLVFLKYELPISGKIGYVLAERDGKPNVEYL